ncbi:MAG: hypothetical protein JY451_15005 [Erythrobacter sp.]|nr:MAG: hypothetical protein JY451_15005 [Erythrobacter sp.]
MATIPYRTEQLAAVGKELILVGPVPTPRWDVASEVSRSIAFNRPLARDLAVSQEDFLARHAMVVNPMQARLGARFVRPHEAICDGAQCHWVLDGRAIFADANHVAEAELSRFAPYFTEALAAPTEAQ